MVAIADIKVESNAPARMRDGVTLRADVYRPAASGSYPVLLTRTPYGKTRMPLQVDNAKAMAARGYIVVVQDTRGRFESEGEYRL
ncbi:MAG TPA: CocE/NonD family hydrolase, partial [Dehalococcoidia bacterium]|nr:CocE/NonD family hydrolase [Dehalococcoidia bacterium]